MGQVAAMGGSASQEIGGVRVFKVSPGSPAQEAGLEVFFDFILEVNGTKIDPSSQQVFAEKIQESENGQAKMTVFNTRAHSTREVSVMPRKWAGSGLLGATVRYDMVDPAENHGIRVLEVFPNSPAAHAGLVPFQDFLLGTAQAVFHDIDELVEVVTANINQRMQVYVYNTDSESVREVVLVPNTDWGGEGCIGCDIGTGLLHRIPAPRRPPGANPSISAGEALAPATLSQGAAGVASMPGALPNVPGLPGGIARPGGAAQMAVPLAGAWPPGSSRAVAGVTWPPTQPPQDDEAAVTTSDSIVATTAASVAAADVTAPPPALPTSAVTAVATSASPPPTLPGVGAAVASPTPTSSTMDVTGAPSPNSLVHGGPSASELPRAPPGTPMNLEEVPPPTDLTAATDPARFGGASSPQPGASGAELYYMGSPAPSPASAPADAQALL